MAFSEDNQNWIREEIRSAIHPNGWKKVANFLRYWGILGICITAFVALIAIIITLAIFATNRISQESEFRGTTQVKLTDVETRLGRIETSLLSLRAAKAANIPTDKKNIAEAKIILDTAKQSGIKLPTDVVEQSGIAFIDAALKEPAAWNVALDFLNYRSALNSYTREVKTVASPPYTLHFELGPAIDGKSIPVVRFVALAVDPKDAARFEGIGQNLNQELKVGTPQLMLNGGALSLDDKYVRHVIFDGVEIHYTGKPLTLQDAVFANCTFVLENTQPGRQLGQALLASSPTSFQNPG